MRECRRLWARGEDVDSGRAAQCRASAGAGAGRAGRARIGGLGEMDRLPSRANMGPRALIRRGCWILALGRLRPLRAPTGRWPSLALALARVWLWRTLGHTGLGLAPPKRTTLPPAEPPQTASIHRPPASLGRRRCSSATAEEGPASGARVRRGRGLPSAVRTHPAPRISVCMCSTIAAELENNPRTLVPVLLAQCPLPCGLQRGP